MDFIFYRMPAQYLVGKCVFPPFKPPVFIPRLKTTEVSDYSDTRTILYSGILVLLIFLRLTSVGQH